MLIDHCRNKKELKKLYYERPMPIMYDWDFLINNPNLFCFYDEDTKQLKGFISIQTEKIQELGKKVLTLSGTSVRKNMSDNIQAIIKICEAFNDDMYSLTPKREAALVLLKAGFKKISNNLYRRVKNGRQ